MERISTVFRHIEVQKRPDDVKLTPTSAKEALSDNDVVICAARRTPICKARRGGFKDTLPDDLLAAAFQAVITETGIDPAIIGDICIGNVLQPGGGAQMSRIAQFISGIPETVPISVTNRFCSSGLQAAMNIAQAIKAGHIDIGMAGGVESMTLNSMAKPPEGFHLNSKVFESENGVGMLTPMGVTSENVAERFGVSKADQDRMAVESHAKAAYAQKMGWFNDELVHVKTVTKDSEGNETEVTISQDDGIRPGTTVEKLAKLRPAFKEGGTTTAGNSSQMSDGAAAVILARRSAAMAHGLPIMGCLRGFAVVGVQPDVMGIGPAYAIPAALKNAGLELSDIDVFEINEAFASQATYCVRKLGIPLEKLNPKGGAIALGHPLGCTGARQIATLLHELKRRGKRANGVVSMCIGTGMGAAAIFEYPGK